MENQNPKSELQPNMPGGAERSDLIPSGREIEKQKIDNFQSKYQISAKDSHSIGRLAEMYTGFLNKTLDKNQNWIEYTELKNDLKRILPLI